MNVLRTIFTRFSYAILPLLLFTFGLSWSLYMVFGTPQPLESALKQSGIYTVFAQNTIEEQATSNTALPLQDAGVQAAIQKAFPPSLIEQSTTKIIDGTYDWVQGRTESPNFSIDLSEPKANLATYVADYVRERSAALPICSYQESLALAQAGTTNVDPYTLTCRPSQVSSDQLAEQAKQQVLGSDLLSTPVVTADSIKNDRGQTLGQQLEIVPQAYTWMIYSLFGTGIIAVLAIGIIVLLQRAQWRGAVKRLSIILISIGAVSAGVAWIISLGFNKISSILADGTTSQMLQTKLVAVFTALAHDLQKWWIGYGIVLIVLGIIGLIIRKLSKEPAAPVIEHQTLNTERSVNEAPKPFIPPSNTDLPQ